MCSIMYFFYLDIMSKLNASILEFLQHYFIMKEREVFLKIDATERIKFVIYFAI